MKLYQNKHINNLPDVYNKEEISNNYKLLKLSSDDVDNFRDLLQEISDSLDLNNAKGKTLDLYGEIVGQNRGEATDEQYILLIKTRIMRNLCNGNHNSVVKCLCAIIGCKPSDIMIIEKDAPRTIEITKIPLAVIQKADLAVNQVTELIKTITPITIIIESILYEGTFTFANTENEYNEDEGFCDVEGGTMGGYLGVLAGNNNNIVLPI